MTEPAKTRSRTTGANIPRYSTAAEVFDGWRDDLLTGAAAYQYEASLYRALPLPDD